MLPLRDDVPAQKAPVVTVALIIVNAAIFLLSAMLPERELHALFLQYGYIPAKIFRPEAVEQFYAQQFNLLVPSQYGLGESVLSGVTCMFLHGGWLHVIGNMWILWIFGDNVEDAFGHIGFLLFYLGCGITSTVAHTISDPFSPVPTVGASGAIAGVMGAYMLLYPRARVLTLVFIFFFIDFWPLPAFLFLIYWFFIQVLSGVASIGASEVLSGGVAWWAHVGGFVAGLGLVVATGVRPPQRARRTYAPDRVYLDPRTGRIVRRRSPQFDDD